MPSFTAAAIGIGTSVVGGVATKEITSAIGGGSSSGGSSSGSGSGSSGTTVNTNNFSGAGLITPATSIVGAEQQADIAQQTADVQSGDIEAGRLAGIEPLAPYNNTGTAANTQLADLEGLNGPEAQAAAMAKFTKSPGYDYQLSEGLRAVDQGAAAKGLLRSGATLKAEQTLGNNLAKQDFSDYVTRLNSLITPGLSAAKDISGTNVSAAEGQSKIAGTLGTNLGNAAAAGTTAIGNLIGTGINSLSKLIGNNADGSRASGFGPSGNFVDSGSWDTSYGTGGTTSAANNNILNQGYRSTDGGVGVSGVEQGRWGSNYVTNQDFGFSGL